MAFDPTRRTLLAGSTMTLLATSSASMPIDATAALARSAPGPLSARNFGAIGDGQRHPLSERFTTLGEAQRIYPFATSLEQTQDWAGVQAAVNAVEGLNDRRVHVPAGRYRLSNSIRLPNFIDFFGDGPGSTIFDNEKVLLREPQIVNAASSFLGVAIRLMSLHGGTHALKASVPNGEIAWLTMEGVACNYQSDKNIECDRLLQSSEFRNCGFSLSPFGVYVAGPTTNSVTFLNCNFEQHSRTALHLRSAEVVNFYGGKFEGGGAAPDRPGEERVTIDLENAGGVNFNGVYFEATHEILLKDLRSRGGVSFEGCHFTGGSRGAGLVPYRFVSNGMITFGTNDWYLESDGPPRMVLTGHNGQKLAGKGQGVEILSRSSRQQCSFSASRAVPPSGMLPLVTAGLVGPLAAGDTLLLTGDLVLHGTVRPHAGGTALVSRRYHLRLAATGSAVLSGRIQPVTVLDDPGVDLSLHLRATGGGSMVEAMLRGAEAATLQWSFESLSMIANGTRIEAEIPPG